MFGQGLIPEDPARYRSFPATPLYRAFLPVAVDLSARFPTPGHQGASGACVGWAVGYAARSYYVLAREGGPRNNASNIPSPAYLYDSVRLDAADCRQGTTISDTLELLKSGALSLARYPFSPKSCRRPTAAEAAVAHRFRIESWRRVPFAKADNIKGQLAAGNPVVVGMHITDSLRRLGAGQIYRGEGTPAGSHAMTMVGYDDRRQAFKAINSWGRRWADDGFGWLDYATVTRNAHGAFVMEVAARTPLTPGPAPVPGPAPLPPRPAPVQVVPTPQPTRTPQPTPVPPPAPTPPTPKPAPVPAPVPVPKPGPSPILVPTPIPAPKPAPATDVEALLPTFQCARLALIEREGSRRVNGFVGSREDLARLQAAAGGSAIDLDVAVHAWPQCEALLTFERAFAAPAGPKLAVRGGARELTAGQALVLELETPDYPSYLYLAYVTASGDVVHLIQPEGPVPRPHPPGERIVLGDGHDGGPRFTVAAPFGDEMIIAFAAQSPLFDAPRPPGESERDFLTAFRKVFVYKPRPDMPDRVIRADYVTLTTRER